MINLALWHDIMASRDPNRIGEIIADDCVFLSPVVFTPQEGKEITKLYLGAAGATFSEGGDNASAGSLKESKFRYTKEVAQGNHTILEFETEIDGKYINGVDIITWNDEGKISEFKVMVRPLQAVNMLHAKMKAMLEKMAG